MAQYDRKISKTVDTSSEYILTSAVISSDRTEFSTEISAVTSEFVIYEHIEKPYLTMMFQFYDDANIVQTVDIQGGEKLTIKLQQTEEVDTATEIVKEFVIDKITSAVKADERSEIVVLHCTEYHAFESIVQTVNKCYNGSPSSIIENIITNHTNKKIVIDGVDSVNDMKVIIPNLNPIEAAMWLKERTTTALGLPFFLFSPLGVNNLVLRSFEEMLKQLVENITTPYVYSSSLINSTGMSKYYAIQNYRYESSDNLTRLIDAGLVNSTYSFYDIHRGIPETINFKAENMFETLTALNLLGGENKRYNYAPNYKVKDKKISNYSSHTISKISSTGAYRGRDIAEFRSYGDETLGGDHNKIITSKSIKGFLSKTPLMITVKGREFITGNNNYTIGKTIRIIFLDTDPVSDKNAGRKDLKKSGDYIIVGAKHTFAEEQITSELLCGKIASLGEEIQL
jgi:hypothetical protein